MGLCWVLLGCLWPILGLCCAPGVALGLCSLYFGLMLDHLGTMLGFVGSSWAYVGPSWDYVGPSWVLCLAILALCWPILGLCCAVLGLWKKDIKVQKLYENMFTSQFFTVVAVFFLHIARFRSVSLEATKSTKFVQVRRTFCSNLTPCNSAQNPQHPFGTPKSANQHGKRRKAFKYIQISRVADYHGSAVK